ncbi:MAG: anti-sigma factor family protein [Bryobacteraceae bacterium]
MTPCRPHSPEQQEALVAYSAGRMGAARARELERHIADCEHCARFCREQQAVWGALDGWQAAAISRDFDHRLMARIEAHTRRPQWLRWTEALAGWRVAAPALALGLVVAVGIFVTGDGAPDPGLTARSVEIAEPVDFDQVESALDDLEMLRQFGSI